MKRGFDQTSRAIALLPLVLAGCVATRDGATTGPASGRLVTTLYFGLSMPDGRGVSEADFQSFVDREITPRFPNGFTLLSAEGAWGDGGKTVREPSRLLVRVREATSAADGKIEAIRAAYIEQFKQQAVLRVDQPATTVSF